MDVKEAIEKADPVALERLLAENSSRANELITWGDHGQIRTHPLHYISDMLISGVLPRGSQTALLEVLIAAGANVNHGASNGETPLIGAASLGTEDVGLRLLDSGARPNERGAFGETALHWAAHEGLARLARGLVEKGADVAARDLKYDASPIGWLDDGAIC